MLLTTIVNAIKIEIKNRDVFEPFQNGIQLSVLAKIHTSRPNSKISIVEHCKRAHNKL